jgi:hypothetical protein
MSERASLGDLLRLLGLLRGVMPVQRGFQDTGLDDIGPDLDTPETDADNDARVLLVWGEL